ncbi:hypothetical protein PIN31115_01901 [Pandoraea iniqua]|uniref:ABC-type transport auxiliary lipoprotein component domain-containing protein n=1 Tax=Pandoraea iniqua TaxID=2508288 RepID=A0A5E4UBX2_9BURK|nr:PqiC family protein [Pandoraea iniqua]VVD97042.1 hypothetical protein PIN31115_01901 [Pandoraea iniqua]
MMRPTDMFRSSRSMLGRRAVASAATATMAGLVLAMAGCASPTPSFYTLAGAGGASNTANTASAGNVGSNAPATPYAIEVSPVAVPEQVDRPQIVVTKGGGQVDILEASRWAAPLKNELTSTISRGLTQRLGAMDVYGLPRADGVTVYRLSTSVQRFESAPGEQAALTAVWTVRRVPGDVVLTCRFNGTEPASGGIPEVVAAQRKLVGQLTDSIGRAIATSAQGATPRCDG